MWLAGIHTDPSTLPFYRPSCLKRINAYTHQRFSASTFIGWGWWKWGQTEDAAQKNHGFQQTLTFLAEPCLLVCSSFLAFSFSGIPLFPPGEWYFSDFPLVSISQKPWLQL